MTIFKHIKFLKDPDFFYSKYSKFSVDSLDYVYNIWIQKKDKANFATYVSQFFFFVNLFKRQDFVNTGIWIFPSTCGNLDVPMQSEVHARFSLVFSFPSIHLFLFSTVRYPKNGGTSGQIEIVDEPFTYDGKWLCVGSIDTNDGTDEDGA